MKDEKINELMKAKEAKLQMINVLAAQGEDVSALHKEVQKIDMELAQLRKAPTGMVQVGKSVISYPVAALLIYGSYKFYQNVIKPYAAKMSK